MVKPSAFILFLKRIVLAFTLLGKLVSFMIKSSDFKKFQTVKMRIDKRETCYVSYFWCACDDCRRQRVGEQVGPRALSKKRNNFFGSCRVAAGGAAQRFAQRRVDNVHAVFGQIQELFGATPCFAQKTRRMTLVNEDERSIFVSQIANVSIQIG